MILNLVKSEPLAAVFAACVTLIPLILAVFASFGHAMTDQQSHAVMALVAGVGVIVARSQVTPNRP